MKKMLMGVLAMLLVLTMGTTVFASPSPNPDTGLDLKAQEWNNKVEHVAATGANNQIYNVTKKRVDASKVNSVNEVIKTVSSQAEVIGMSDLSVDKGVDTSKGIKVTLSINPKSIINGYSVYVVHQYGEGKWETVKPCSVTSDGKVTVTLYSLSPVAIVQYPNNVSVPISDPSKNKPDSTNNTNNNTNSTENSNSNTTNSKHTVRGNLNSRTHQTFRSYPCSILNGDFTDHKVKSRFLVVVIATKQHSPLADADITANRHLSQIVYPHVFTDPCVVPDFQSPWVFYVYFRLNNYSFPDFRTK